MGILNKLKEDIQLNYLNKKLHAAAVHAASAAASRVGR